MTPSKALILAYVPVITCLVSGLENDQLKLLRKGISQDDGGAESLGNQNHMDGDWMGEAPDREMLDLTNLMFEDYYYNPYMSMPPSASPSLKPSSKPSASPSLNPSASPSLKPSLKPSASPSSKPSSKPSASPSLNPSASPTLKSSLKPSASPSSKPSLKPSASPSLDPSVSPSSKPSLKPSASPSSNPSLKPSLKPSTSPSLNPSASPSLKPSLKPSASPSLKPSLKPSASPSLNPSASPSMEPSALPSPTPSSRPSVHPKCGMTAEQRREELLEIFRGISGSNVDISNTDQNDAAEWMIEEDCYCVCPPADETELEKVKQRYVLAVFYYSTDGFDWDECAAPLNASDPVSSQIANDLCTLGPRFDDFYSLPRYSDSNAWLSCTYECTWGGLECLNDTNLTDRIDIENNNLAGKIPSELRALTNLRYLYLETDKVTGTIPPELGQTQLVVLDLNRNQVTGTIPTTIFGNSSPYFLLQLDLDDNLMTGTIPTEMALAPFLGFLQLQENEFTGTIPSELGTLQALRIAEFFLNDLTGDMPAQICALRNSTTEPNNPLRKLTADCNNNTNPIKVPCDCCTECPLVNGRSDVYISNDQDEVDAPTVV